MNYQKKIISIIIYLTILFGACYAASKEVGSYLIFIDFPSAIIVVIIALAYSFNKTNKIKSFGDWSCLWRLVRVSYRTNINECRFCLKSIKY